MTASPSQRRGRLRRARPGGAAPGERRPGEGNRDHRRRAAPTTASRSAARTCACSTRTGEFTAEVVTSPAGQFRFFAAPGHLDAAGAVPARQRRRDGHRRPRHQRGRRHASAEFHRLRATIQAPVLPDGCLDHFRGAGTCHDDRVTAPVTAPVEPPRRRLSTRGRWVVAGLVAWSLLLAGLGRLVVPRGRPDRSGAAHPGAGHAAGLRRAGQPGRGGRRRRGARPWTRPGWRTAAGSRRCATAPS